MGELLSLTPSSSYYYEPLFQYHLSCDQRANSSSLTKFVAKTIGSLLSCKNRFLLNNLSKFSRRRNSVHCGKTKLSVVKTIRLHLNGVSKLIRQYPRLKIVHLIRDPRYQLESRLRLRNSFQCEKGDITEYCDSYMDDLKIGSTLPPSLYKLVKYEDLVADPEAIMKMLYDFIRVPMTPQIKQQILDHFNAENLDRKVK